MAKSCNLYVGTRKGGFIFSSNLNRKRWKLEGPFFAGQEVHHLVRDPRDGRLWAAVNNAWFGSDLQVSANGGKKWQKASNGLGFAPERNLTLKRIWRIAADRESRPQTLWCGVDPGALFRTDDGGKNWQEVPGLNQHATRDLWNPGAGGLMVHRIVPDAEKAERIYVGISAAGTFRSDDDGQTWKACNQGVRADFMPNKFPEVGQCVHALVAGGQPGVLFQQNHCGVYRTRDGGETWQDISRGLPSRFGFPIVAHPHEAETIYVVPENGAEQRYVCDGKLGVYRSKNGGKSWELLTRGLPKEDVYTQVLRHAMAADTCDDAGIYVGTIGGSVFYSRNSGNAWEELRDQLPPVLSLEAAVF